MQTWFACYIPIATGGEMFAGRVLAGGEAEALKKFRGLAPTGEVRFVPDPKWEANAGRPPLLNSFQKWADDYARAFGFIVTPKGNWVELTKDGATVECMSAAAVQAACGGMQ